MKILRGGSAEIKPNKWHKFDIELDESDLQAIVVKHNLDYSKLTVISKYKILVKQAEILVTAEMNSQGVQGEQSLGELTESFNNYVAGLQVI